MSMTERETHFQGFAKLLYPELRPLFKKLFEAIYPLRDTHGEQQLEYLIKLTLARHAYDLVFHLLKNGGDLALDMGGYRDKPHDDTVYDHIEMLPDLTDWPAAAEAFAAMVWEETILATDLSELDFPTEEELQ